MNALDGKGVIIKKSKTHPSALLSYISTREFSRTREKRIEKHEAQLKLVM